MDTQLEARIQNALSKTVIRNIGAPQGDSLSPIIFIIYLELAMKQIRAAVPQPPRDDKARKEIIYADDTDCIITLIEVTESLKEKFKLILVKWNLKIDDDKIELITLRREKTRLGGRRRNLGHC